ncbi:protein associated with UVRAG as autophagy enhancer [Paramormyrops kingsleyae]|uniref:protein associated with UVRAG as autophagy enhancer n=1 Tax=Paramormyrops kingsleyae TaxID=1676925 RepID=UPI003B97A789
MLLILFCFLFSPQVNFIGLSTAFLLLGHGPVPDVLITQLSPTRPVQEVFIRKSYLSLSSTLAAEGSSCSGSKREESPPFGAELDRRGVPHRQRSPVFQRWKAHTGMPPVLLPGSSRAGEKPHCASLSSGLNRFLNTLLQHPLSTQPRTPKACTSSSTSPAPGPTEAPHRGAHASEQIHRVSRDLDKENAHFIVVDMVLEVLEEAVWASQTQRGPRLAGRRGQRKPRHRASAALSAPTADIQPVDSSPIFTQAKPPGDQACDPGCGTDQISATGSADSSPLKSSLIPTIPCSAEALAQQLMSAFWKQWLPQQSRWCRSGPRVLRLDELLSSRNSMMMENSPALTEEIRQKSRMRGTHTWTPPRFQIICNIHPPKKRSTIVASQQYLCAGCGTEVEVRYIKKLRYCEYLGKYLCDCCHSLDESVVPGHIVEHWDFTRYPVCNFSKQLLENIWHQPLFNATSISRSLHPRPRELEKFRELQEQLVSIKKFLAACRLADGLLQEFQQLPHHLTQDPPLLSLDDLLGIKRGSLVAQAKALLRKALAHVDHCELCLANGFICEFCQGSDVIFPFQKETCKRCTACKACFHSDCFRNAGCPRCTRIETRKKLMDPCAVPEA